MRKTIFDLLFASLCLYGIGMLFQIAMIDAVEMRVVSGLDGDRPRAVAAETALHVGLFAMSAVACWSLWRSANRNGRI